MAGLSWTVSGYQFRTYQEQDYSLLKPQAQERISTLIPLPTVKIISIMQADQLMGFFSYDAKLKKIEGRPQIMHIVTAGLGKDTTEPSVIQDLLSVIIRASAKCATDLRAQGISILLQERNTSHCGILKQHGFVVICKHSTSTPEDPRQVYLREFYATLGE